MFLGWSLKYSLFFCSRKIENSKVFFPPGSGYLVWCVICSRGKLVLITCGLGAPSLKNHGRVLFWYSSRTITIACFDVSISC